MAVRYWAIWGPSFDPGGCSVTPSWVSATCSAVRPAFVPPVATGVVWVVPAAASACWNVVADIGAAVAGVWAESGVASWPTIASSCCMRLSASVKLAGITASAGVLILLP